MQWRRSCSFHPSKRVAGAAAAFRVADKNAAFDERQNVAQCCVLGTLGELRIFRCGELTLEAVQETVKHKALTIVERDSLDTLPEACFNKDSAESGLRPVNGASQTAEKPFHPARDVHRSFLRLLQDAVVSGTLLPNLCGHAVEALWAVFRTRQSHIGEGS